MKQLWSDTLTSKLNSGSRIRNLLGALLFGTAVWFTGLVAFSLSGLTLQYVASPFSYGFSFLYIPYMLIGISYLYYSYLDSVKVFRKHLRVADPEFEALRSKLHGLVLNNWIVIAVTVALVLVFDDDFHNLVALSIAGRLNQITIALLWSNGLSLLDLILLATGIWLVANIWYGIFSVSKMPLGFKPERFANQFRPLASLNLVNTSFYLGGLGIPGILNALYAIFSPSAVSSSQDLLIVLYFLLIIPGIIGFLAPHIFIHRTLKQAKEQELKRIDKEMGGYLEKIRQQQIISDSANVNDFMKFSSNQMWLYSQLYALQADEKRVADARDWPLDLRMLSLFIVAIIVPSLVNIFSVRLARLLLP